MDTENTSNITNNSIVNQFDYDHLQNIFNDYINTVLINDIENVFSTEIPKLKSACVQVLQQIENELKFSENEIDETILENVQHLLNVYINLLKLFLNAVTFINIKMEFQQIPSLPLPVCETLLLTFQHFQQSEIVYGKYRNVLTDLLTILFKQTIQLQTDFLTFLNTKLIFNEMKENDVIVIIAVIEIFSTMGQIVYSLDIKSATEIWKAYITLSQTYGDLIRTRMDISRPLNYLCSEVITVLHSITAEMQPTDMKTTKLLKIINFNLRLIIKLCELHSDNLGDAYEKIYELLITLNRYSPSYLKVQKYKSNFIDLIETFVSTAIEPLLRFLITDRQFVQIYFKNFHSHLTEDSTTILSVILLSISIIKKLFDVTTEERDMWISTDTSYNIICIILLSLDHLHYEFSCDLSVRIPTVPGELPHFVSLYELLLVHTVSFIVCFNIKQFNVIQLVLVKCLLQTNVWQAMFASDVWCILARFGSAELCFYQLEFLLKILSILRNQRRPETIYLREIIRRFYLLLTDNYKIIIQQNYLDIRSIIGVNYSLPALRLAQYETTINKINKFFIYDCLTEDFNNMCDCLQMLCTQIIQSEDDSFAQNLTSQITKLWQLNADDDIMEQIWFTKFTILRLRVTSHFIKYISNADLLEILMNVNEICNFNLRLKIGTISLLNSLSTHIIHVISPELNSIFEQIVEIFIMLMDDSNPIVKQNILECFTGFALKTNHRDLLFSNIIGNNNDLSIITTNYLKRIVPNNENLFRYNYLRLQSKELIRHNCVAPQEQKFKKIKISSNIDIVSVVNTMLNNCNLVSEHCKLEKLTNELKSNISNVILKLESLLD